MPASKSDQLNVERRRARVAEAYLKGRKQFEIAADEGVHATQISRDLDAIRQAWRDSAIRDFDEDRNRELARIDVVEREYWDAWERSKSERTRSRTKRRTGSAPSDEASVEREQRDGNPAFLDGVMRCVEKRCKILGLDAPEQHEHHLTIEQRQARLDSLLQTLRQRARGGGDRAADHRAEAN